jgi:hypothetical protein
MMMLEFSSILGLMTQGAEACNDTGWRLNQRKTGKLETGKNI